MFFKWTSLKATKHKNQSLYVWLDKMRFSFKLRPQKLIQKIMFIMYAAYKYK